MSGGKGHPRDACTLPVELEQHKWALAGVRVENEELQRQVADKDKLTASQEVKIAPKEEIISLLCGGYNRPN